MAMLTHPTLRHADTVVIGAGLTGCSVAYQLAKRGRPPLVLDLRGIAAGASGRNGGMTGVAGTLQRHAGRAVIALTRENFRMLQDELPGELDDDFQLRVTGSLDLFLDDTQAARAAAEQPNLDALGIHSQLLDRTALRDLVPSLSEHVVGARLLTERGHLWPFALVWALARGAQAFGARIVAPLAVTRLLITNGAVTGVVTPDGVIETGTVVIAANAWAGLLLPDLPPGALVPARGQILVTEPAPPLVPLPFAANDDKEYGRQTPDGRVLCGGFRRLDEHTGLGIWEERTTPPVLQAIAALLVRLFPDLARVRVRRAWAGLMGFTADGLPLIGAYGGIAGLYVAAGFNGGGFSWGAAVGKALAQLICLGQAAFDLAPFDPNRFARTDIAWTNPFTAGEPLRTPRQ